jgi:hypothetical protein
VSRDEEYIALAAHEGDRVLDLGERAHHAVLLALARARLADQAPAQGESPSSPAEVLPESAHGWMYQDELGRMLQLDETQINLLIFRCRRQLAAAGVVGAAGIVERRRATRQLRLGVARIEIVTV